MPGLKAPPVQDRGSTHATNSTSPDSQSLPPDHIPPLGCEPAPGGIRHSRDTGPARPECPARGSGATFDGWAAAGSREIMADGSRLGGN